MKTKFKIAALAMMGMSLGVNAQKDYYVTEKSNEYSNGDVRIFSHSGSTFGLTMRPYNSNFNGGTFNWHKDFGYREDLNNWYVETNFGIGTTSPSQKLEVKGNVLLKSDSYVHYAIERGNGAKSAFGITSTTHDAFLSSSGNLKFLTNNNGSSYNTAMFLNREGQLGIGTLTTGNHKLAVEGSIGAREIKVEANGWSDFVFEKDYNLPTLFEVENHIKEKGHLKDIPSAKEVEQNGFYLGEMDAKLLQKIEELTLYTIAQEKKIKALEMEKANNKKQQKEIEEQRNKIERLEFLVQKLLKDKN